MALTDMTVRNAKPQDKAYKLTDSIGPYPKISLSEARSKRDDARKLLANGINPAQQKQRYDNN